MGIKDLWPILTPFCDRKPLYELQGKKVAIDLSGWVCESQCVTDYNIQPRMYLRTLYFRTCCLLMMDVSPVFVLEGKAPELKHGTIAARNAIQFKGAKPRKEGFKPSDKKKGRSRFNHVLKKCEEMLQLMGLACVKGEGEAEALCAYLNEDNLVDGIISQDSDCFAYGGRVVYRNFSISQQGANASKNGSVDVCDISKVESALNLGRNKIVALALLCGSDYSDGVHGVGKESVLKLFEEVGDDKILEKLKTWREKSDHYEILERKILDKNICTSCGHQGKIQAHTKIGCIECGTGQGCDASKYKDKRLAIKNELSVRSKALADPSFPDENILDEFLKRKDDVSELNLKWKKPNLIKFVQFTNHFLGWEETYSVEKFLPLLTRWQLIHHEVLKKKSETSGILTAERIKKIRNPRGVPSFEIIWKDGTGCFVDLIPAEQLAEIDVEKLWSTIEPQHLVESAHPSLVKAFLDSKRKPAAKRPKKKRDKKDVADLSDLLENISISEPKPKKIKKPKKKVQSNTLDAYLIPQTSSTPVKLVNKVELCPSIQETFKENFENVSLKINKHNETTFNLSNEGNETFDLSRIVDNIMERKIPKCISDNLNKLGFEIVEDTFFTINDNEDVFERTFKEEQCKDSDSDEFDFIETYVPLQERLKSICK